MDALIDKLRAELNISQEEAVDILKAIVEFVENQHPVLLGMSEELLEKELLKIKAN